MNKLMNLLVVACLTSGWAYAQAPAPATATAPATPATAPKKAVKKPTAKQQSAQKSAKTAERKSGPLLDDEDKEFDAAGAAVTEVNCELGNKVTLYRNAADTEHMALRWNQRVHRMTKVSTTTGANRFENTKYGLVWIGIPAKGMLLDAKKGQQLANECKDAEQSAPAAVPVTPPAEPTRPADLPEPVDPQRAVPKLKS
ncbi:MAG: hypothetical protein V4695_04240 [Pseudomonadota bacterium]